MLAAEVTVVMVLVLLAVTCSSMVPETSSPSTEALPTSSSSTWQVPCPAECSCNVKPSPTTSRELRTVDCAHMKLKSIPRPLPLDTESLNLAGNFINDLLDQVPDLVDLNELDLADNRIKNLGRGYIFHNLSGLQNLSLANNELSVVSSNVFRGLSSLKSLVLYDNKISFIEDTAFHGLTALKLLDLGRNQLSGLYPESFRGLSNLTELHLYENRIHQLNSAIFLPLQKLEHLSLFGNRITDISDDAFWKLDRVKTLHLERNYLTEVPAKALRNLSALSDLYLSGNPIARLRRQDFAAINIQKLVLNAMPLLGIVEAGAFAALPKLTFLEIQYCPNLSYIDPQAFVNVTSLTTLHLQNNRLKDLSSSIIDSLVTEEDPRGMMRERLTLGLLRNPLVCDCSLRWMVKAVNSNSSSVHFLDADQLTCATDRNLSMATINANGTHRFRDIDPSMVPMECPPTIVPVQEAVLEKKLGDRLYLDCRAVGNPSPSMWWTLPSGRVVNATGTHQPGTLFFDHLKVSDGGNYTCVADNPLGSAETTLALRVHRIDIHLFPTGVSATFVTLVWNGTARNSYPQFRLLYRMDEGGTNASRHRHFEHVVVSPFHRSYTVNNLVPDRSYEFCIAYEDTDRTVVQLSCTGARTHDADYMTRGIRRTSNVAVAIVLTIVAVMIVVVCLVTVAARKYRQRQYVCPDKPNAHYMAQIPLENLYSPLMSSIGP